MNRLEVPALPKRSRAVGIACCADNAHEAAMPTQEHWQTVYPTKSPTAVSWFQEHAVPDC